MYSPSTEESEQEIRISLPSGCNLTCFHDSKSPILSNFPELMQLQCSLEIREQLFLYREGRDWTLSATELSEAFL